MYDCCLVKGGDIMSFSEFPSTNYADINERELIELYKSLVEKYSGTLDEITQVRNNLNKYERDMDTRVIQIQQQLEAAIDNEVAMAIRGYEASTNAKLTAFENKLNMLDSKIDSAVKNMNDKIDSTVEQIRLENEQTIRTVDSKLARVEGKMNTVEAIMSQIEQEQQRLVNAMAQTYNNMIAQVEQYNNTMQLWVLNELTKNRDYVCEYMEDKVSYLESLVETVELHSSGHALGWLWTYALSIGGFDCMEWSDFTEMTCSIWNNSEITCAEWYTDGKRKLRYQSFLDRFFSPLTGYKVDCRTAIYELALLINKDAITAKEYDDLMLTADAYEERQIEAYDYDWKGKVILNE